jgi:predicted acetyltransferase
LADNLVRVRELIALTPEAEGALWRLVLDLDLAGTVRIGNRPLDEPCQPTLDATYHGGNQIG